MMYVVLVLNLNVFQIGMFDFYWSVCFFLTVHVIGLWHMQFARSVWFGFVQMGCCFSIALLVLLCCVLYTVSSLSGPPWVLVMLYESPLR